MAQGENIVAIDGFRAEPVAAPHRGGKELSAGTTLLHGQYTLMGYLDSGGFGITYRAIDSLGRSVVVKECFPAELCVRAGLQVRVRNPGYARDLADIVGQFVSEARSLAKLRHRGIVEVHQVFMENETAYIAMEHVDGPDLLSLIEDGRRKFRPTEIESLAIKLLKAIGYVHKRGLLHRDIAPDNILIERGGQPKLIDFGAVRGHDASAEESGFQLKCVKDGYSPDEFYDPLRGHGFESDIYSLGATLHHMVTGAAPVDAEMRRRAIEQGQGDPYLPLEGRYRGYTRGFLASIDTALSFRPEDRHASAREWARSIARAASERPVAVQRTAPLYDEKTQAPKPEAVEATPGHDVMPWVGIAAAAVGVLLSLYGPDDVFAPETAESAVELAGLAVPRFDTSVDLANPYAVGAYAPAGVPRPAALPDPGPLAFVKPRSTPAPVVAAVPPSVTAPQKPVGPALVGGLAGSPPNVAVMPVLPAVQAESGVAPNAAITAPPAAPIQAG